MLPIEIWEIVCRALPTPAAHRAFALTCRDFAAITSAPVVLKAAIAAFSQEITEAMPRLRNVDCRGTFKFLPCGWKHGYYSIVSNSNGVVIEDGLMHCNAVVFSWVYKNELPQVDDVKLKMEYILNTSTMIPSSGLYHRTIVPRLSSKLFWFRQCIVTPVFLSLYIHSTHVMVFRENVLVYRVDLIFMAGCYEKHGNEYIWDDDGLFFHAVWSSGQCLSHSCPRNPSLTPFSYVFTKRMSCDDLLE